MTLISHDKYHILLQLYTQILVLCYYQYDGSEYKISNIKLEYLYSDTRITQSSEYNIS